MNNKFMLVVLAFSCVPAAVTAGMNQCKNADGTVLYTDQPCAGAFSARPIDDGSDPPQEIIDLILKDHLSKEESKRVLLYYDKDFYQHMDQCKITNTLEACKIALKAHKRMLSDLANICKKGNKKACELQTELKPQ